MALESLEEVAKRKKIKIRYWLEKDEVRVYEVTWSNSIYVGENGFTNILLKCYNPIYKLRWSRHITQFLSV